MRFLAPIEWRDFATAHAQTERAPDGSVEPCPSEGAAHGSEAASRAAVRGAAPRRDEGRTAARAPAAKPRGVTVVELMVVLAIMGIMMGLGGYALSGATNTQLRSDAGAVTAAIKYTYANAAINNTQYRLVFNLDTGEYRSEVVKSAIVEITSTSTNNGEDFLTEEAQKLADKVEEERDLFADDEENPFGMNRKVTYERVEDGVLKKTKLKEGNKFARIRKANSDEEYTDGEVSMSFFPNGFQEAVQIELKDEGGASFTLVTEPLTGRVMTYTNPDDVPENFGEVEEDE